MLTFSNDNEINRRQTTPRLAISLSLCLIFAHDRRARNLCKTRESFFRAEQSCIPFREKKLLQKKSRLAEFDLHKNVQVFKNLQVFCACRRGHLSLVSEGCKSPLHLSLSHHFLSFFYPFPDLVSFI